MHIMSILKTESIDLRGVHPFVKWAGGKGQLLPELNKMIPRQFNSYLFLVVVQCFSI